jgi:hypothetical protein
VSNAFWAFINDKISNNWHGVIVEAGFLYLK